ncbi:MAG: NADH-quinone oxidoreductase subunit H [Elusimicrobia bacterium]|nr:NADH-quinone oxidoreductase subunit H [Elusimicrobiota bacterium]
MNNIKSFVFLDLPFVLILPFFAAVLDRRLVAISRVRPKQSIFQPFYEVMKLLGSETLLPKEGSIPILLLAPLVALTVMVFAAMVSLSALLAGELLFSDAFLLFYIFLILPFVIGVGALASGNPLSIFDLPRAVSRMIVADLPFIAVLTAFLFRSGSKTSHLFVPSSFLAFIVTIISFGAKSVEILDDGRIDKFLLEYSGPPLALFTVSRWFFVGLLPIFVLLLFLSPLTVYGGIIKYFAVFILIFLVKEILSRLDPAHRLKILFGPLNVLALSMLLLAALGL